MFASVQSLVIWSQRFTKSDVLKFGPVSASEQDAETFHEETAICFRPNVSYKKTSIDQSNQQIVRRKVWDQRGVRYGGDWPSKMRKTRFFQRFSSDSCVLLSASYDVKLIRATSLGGARWETHWHVRRQNVEWPTAARAVSRSMWQRRKFAPKWQHVCITGWYDDKDRRAQ